MSGVVLVTGGSRGIGRATAEWFLGRGWKVAVNYLSDDLAADEVAAGDRERCRAYRADVTDQDAVQEMATRIAADLGPVDVLVNNAGLWRGGLIQRVELDDFRRVVEVCVVGARNCTIAVLDAMRERGSGHILNVSSAVAVAGWKGDTAYATAKAGVIGLTRALAKEVAADGIRVNAVVPGFIATDMTDGVGPAQRRALVGRTLLKRVGTPVDVARVIYAVATEGVYMTGGVITVDGGFVLGSDDR